MNNAFNHPQTVVVLGGTSEIAGALIDRLIANRCRTVVLAGRDPDALAHATRRATESGAHHVASVVFDALTIGTAEATIAQCFDAADAPVDLVVVAVGVLGNAVADLDDAERIAEIITVNFTWPAVALAVVARRMRAQGSGRIVVLSSVAGMRIRAANFIYGSAKAGVDGFALGLAESLRESGVQLQVVRPGFVRTKMTAGVRAAPFAVDPDDVATAVMRGIERNQPVIWVPSLLRLVFLVLRHLPQAVWRRLPG
jgi:decaprenylphospho-beta-D-erythro-pentofuranosid-2-ulose 2-reductase